MLTNLFHRDTTHLDSEIKRIEDILGIEMCGTEDYSNMLRDLERLNELRRQKRRIPISPELIATIGGNLLITLLILKHEELNVITTKALPFLVKTRV